MAKVYETKNLPDAVVTIEADTLFRRAAQFFAALIAWDSDVLGSYAIVVRDRQGQVRWSEGGYRGGTDPFGCFRELCNEVDYFGLDTFLKRHGAGYFSGR